ncbi:MAG: hypothetical protein FWC18_04950 [Cystobacterineae bacterium]|nr:hypothetical protein [Cystobacterineae bacterium]
MQKDSFSSGQSCTNPQNINNLLDSILDQVKQLANGQSQGTQEAAAMQGTQGTQAAQPKTFEQQYENMVVQLDKHFSLLDTAGGHGNQDGLLNRADLEAAVKSPGLPAELREACQFLLDNPPVFNQMDLAQCNLGLDGLIGEGDVKAALAKLGKTSTQTEAKTEPPPAETPKVEPPPAPPPPPEKSFNEKLKDSVQTILNNFDTVTTAAGGKKNSELYRKEFQAVVNDKSLPKELRDACQFVLDSPTAWNKLDVAAHGGKPDGCISKNDLKGALKKL